MRYMILGGALAAALLITVFPSAASASGANHIVISELQTATTTSASQEFIELYNPTAGDVSLAGWTIEYKAATAADTGWTRRASLTGTIKADGFYLIAPTTYLAAADTDWSATLAGSGGNVRLKDGSGSVVDQLGYGPTANAAEGGAPAPAPPAGQSIERLPGRLDELSGNGVDTDNNATDFVLRTDPQPQNTQALIELPDSGTDDVVLDDTPVVTDPVTTDPDGDAMADPTPAPQNYAPLDITELLVDPMTPFTDAHDEFIELYNPTADPVDVQGYTLRAGSKFHSFYVLPDTTIAPGAYQAFYSSQTKVGLPNTGGAVEILDPDGEVVDVTPAYGAAPEGQSWGRFDDGWHWTLQTTPGQPNVYAVSIVLAAAPTVKPKRVSTPKAAVKKVAKPKKVAVKKAAKPRVKKPKAKLSSAIPVAATQNLQPANWLIIVLGVLTISYAAYEFRYDVYAIYRKLRRDPAPRGAPGESSARRRND